MLTLQHKTGKRWNARTLSAALSVYLDIKIFETGPFNGELRRYVNLDANRINTVDLKSGFTKLEIFDDTIRVQQARMILQAFYEHDVDERSKMTP